MKSKTIAFTNGCFDILHTGHIKILEVCKRYGNEVIVGLNSDDSVRRLKGPNRPVLSADQRQKILDSIKYIDRVIIFEEDTPYELIKRIRPDILVKGEDYRYADIVGSDIVDLVIRVPFINGISTTQIIERIKNGDN